MVSQTVQWIIRTRQVLMVEIAHALTPQAYNTPNTPNTRQTPQSAPYSLPGARQMFKLSGSSVGLTRRWESSSETKQCSNKQPTTKAASRSENAAQDGSRQTQQSSSQQASVTKGQTLTHAEILRNYVPTRCSNIPVTLYVRSMARRP